MDTREEKFKKEQERLKENLSQIKNKLIVISGKGGVGKTTIAVNLAYELALRNYEVGILDVDIHGPNIAKMLGIENDVLSASNSRIEPIKVIRHLKAVSMALLGTSKKRPIIWRGPLKMAAIRQFLSDVNWGKLDYLIVDSPPGTGDEPLSVCQLISDINGAIVVTTPQDVATLDAKKSVLFAKELKVPVLGIIENMSSLICPYCGREINLFSSGGGEKMANELNVPFLGKVPIEPELVELSDSGKPFVYFGKHEKTTKIMREITDKIRNNLKSRV